MTVGKSLHLSEFYFSYLYNWAKTRTFLIYWEAPMKSRAQSASHYTRYIENAQQMSIAVIAIAVVRKGGVGYV